MDENFCIASFRSRQQVMAFERTLTRQGIRAEIITTPRAVAVGCGLSVRFPKTALAQVRALTAQTQPGSLIGLYLVTKDAWGRTAVYPA